MMRVEFKICYWHLSGIYNLLVLPQFLVGKASKLEKMFKTFEYITSMDMVYNIIAFKDNFSVHTDGIHWLYTEIFETINILLYYEFSLLLSKLVLKMPVSFPILFYQFSISLFH